MRISDWSSDVCSSDLVDIGFDVARGTGIAVPIPDAANVTRLVDDPKVVDARLHEFDRGLQAAPAAADDSDFDILRNGGARRLRRVWIFAIPRKRATRRDILVHALGAKPLGAFGKIARLERRAVQVDRKSTRLNSSH